MKNTRKLLFILPVLLLLNSCDAIHEHAFSETYTYDEASHWKEAICEHTDLTKDRGAHIDLDNNKKCDLCGYEYVIAHEHTFSDTYTYDEEYHWYSATCEHNTMADGLEKHEFVDGVCKCGFYNKDMELKDTSTFTDILNSYLTPEMVEGNEFLVQMVTLMGQQFEIQTMGEGEFSYNRYNYLYESTNYDGSKVLLSACMTVPFKDGEPSFTSISIASHPTFTDLSEAPTNGFDIYCAPAIVGSLVIECDLLGYGVSKDQVVDYHCRHLSSRNTVDGVLRAFELIEDNFDVEPTEYKLFNLGYSQGGYDSLALLRYLETEASDEVKDKIVITDTLSGSGAYDLFLMMEKSLAKEDFQYSEYVIMAIQSFMVFHADLLDGVKYENILTEKGMELLEIIRHKNDEELQAFKNKKVGDELYIKGPSDVFRPELTDTTSDLYKLLKEVAEVENLLDGNWNPNGHVTLFYSEGDEMVAPECTLKAQELWASLENVEIEKIGFLLGSDHRSAAVDYYFYVLSVICDAMQIIE